MSDGGGGDSDWRGVAEVGVVVGRWKGRWERTGWPVEVEMVDRDWEWKNVEMKRKKNIKLTF